jgi:hypothetical protein
MFHGRGHSTHGSTNRTMRRVWCCMASAGRLQVGCQVGRVRSRSTRRYVTET